MNISIVIPNFNGKKLLENNLPFVIASAPKAEIIIVDDASTDDSVSFLKTNYPNIILVQNPKNLRFSLTCNRGVKKAKGDIVILLNSDVKPDKNFIKPLISHFEHKQKNNNLTMKQFSNVFSVGCREINNGELSGRTQGKFEKGLFVHTKPIDQESQNTFWTFGGSMAVDRQKFLRLRGFNKIYSPAYWEDIDLCFRAKKVGWLCLFEKNSTVYHNHETTNKSIFGKSKINNFALRNQIIFSLKYNKLQFLLFMPYHLIITTYQTKGLFLLAYTQALFKMLFNL